MHVRELMARAPCTLHVGATVAEAAALMRKYHIGDVPVEDQGILKGMLTNRDIAVRVAAEGLDPAATRVGDVMTPKVFTCMENQQVEDVANIMKTRRIRRVVVLNDERRPAGIVSIDDIAMRGDLRLAAETLREISRPARSRQPAEGVEEKSAPGEAKENSKEAIAMDKNIFDILKEEHRQVQGLFQKALSSKDLAFKGLDDLFQDIEHMLDDHIHGENRFLYPAVMEHEEARQEILEAYEEHRIAQMLIKDIDNLPNQDRTIWRAKVKTLSEIIDHHVEEEENEVFPHARKLLDQKQVKEITEQYLKLTRKPGIAATAGSAV